MPIETKKVLWTALTVSIIVIAAFGMALVFAMPKADASGAPASFAAASPPRATSPEAYIREAEPAPVPVAAPALPSTPSAVSGVIIVYGEKPDAATISIPGYGTLNAQGLQTSPAVPASPGSLVSPQTGQAGSPSASLPATATQPQAAAAVTATAVAAPKPSAPAPSAPKPAAPAPAARTAVPARAVPTAAQPATAARPVQPSAVTEYWIQVASFTSRLRAEDLQRSLVGKGISSIITIQEIDHTTRYRVRIGPFTSKTEAEGWLTKVQQLAGYNEAYISQVQR